MSDKKVMKTMDGNEACATVAYHFTDVAGIYPIAPSSPMSEKVDEWSAAGKKNMFGQPVRLVEMQSEAGAAGALHGVAEAGALATTFTSSQGLRLMIPAMYAMGGQFLPSVMHIASRVVTSLENCGIPNDTDHVVWKYNVPEDEKCHDAATELVEAGCTYIFSDSYGHQPYMQQAATENPDVVFASMTGDTAALSGLTCG